MSPPAVVRAPRLATGDWVVLARSDAGVRGLAKVVDGEWDPRDDALLRARVETAASGHWLAAGDLERLSPEDEADLVARAIEAQVVPEPRASELRARVADFRRGALPFVRSPGLLDRLWRVLTTSDPRPAGLTAFFDRGRDLVPALRDARPDAAPEPPARPAEELRRALVPAEAFDRILDRLPDDALAALCAARGRPALHLQPRPVVRAVLLADGLTLRSLLELLPRAELLEVPALVGLPRLDWSNATVITAVWGQLHPLPPPEPRAPLPDRRASGTRSRHAPPLPATEAEAARRVLARVHPPALPALCEALGAPHLARRTPNLTRDAIAAAELDLGELFEALPGHALRHLPTALGLPRMGERPSRDGLAATVRAGVARIQVVERLLGVLPEGVRATFARDLGAARPLGGDARSLAAALVTTACVDEVLDALTPAELRRTARAFALDLEGAALRAALRDLATPGPPPPPPRRTEGPEWVADLARRAELADRDLRDRLRRRDDREVTVPVARGAVVLLRALRALGRTTLERLSRAFELPPRRDPFDALLELAPPFAELVALLDEDEVRDASARAGLPDPLPDEAPAELLRVMLVARADGLDPLDE